MAWHRRILDLLSVQLIFPDGELYDQQAPVAWWSRSAKFRSRWTDLSGFWIADVERAVRRRRNGAVTANLPTSIEDIPLPAIISRYSDDLTSLLTPTVVPVL